jgi:hypothetical protein
MPKLEELSLEVEQVIHLHQYLQALTIITSNQLIALDARASEPKLKSKAMIPLLQPLMEQQPVVLMMLLSA